MTIMSLFRRGSSSAATEAVATAVAVTQPATESDTDSDTTSTSELILSSDTQFGIIHSNHQEMKVNVKIKAPEEIQEEKRESLDLVCVLDISSSMNGASKLDLCKNTLDFVVSQLSPNDRLSLVTFSNAATTVQKLTLMDEAGKSKFRENVKKVTAQGMTNLSGGLLKGVCEVMEHREDGGERNKIQSVLLLTDGQANVGIKDKDDLVDMLRNYSTQDELQYIDQNDKAENESVGLPFSIFTFGFGSDHNVELLKAVSDCANGVYYFIDDLDKVGNAFGDCLGGLLSIVAQNTTLEITGVNGSSVGEVFTDYPNRRKADKTLVVELGDLYAEEQRNILSSINLNFPPSLFQNAKEDTQMEICQVKLSCVNLVTKKPENKSMGICVSVRPQTIPMKAAEQQGNLTIEIHYNRWETSKTMQEADKMSDNHDMKGKAVELLDARLVALKELEARSPALQSSCIETLSREMGLLSEMQTDLAQCRHTVQSATRGNMAKKKGFMMNKMNKLGRERGNSFSNYSDDEGDFDFNLPVSEGMSTKKVKSVFETRSKTSCKSRGSKW